MNTPIQSTYINIKINVLNAAKRKGKKSAFTIKAALQKSILK